MIPVTKPFLPPKEEYDYYLHGIWQRNWLTNNGPLVNELELRLKELLEVPHFLFLSNGTVALQIAIKALKFEGEVITTPFSYVATTSSIVWEGCTPIFVDIDSQSLNIDPGKIEESITEKTTGIIATHVYGNPCDIGAIEDIAKRNNLKVVYDGAHGFGTKYKGLSVFRYGDISTSSFHATKLFHTIEGGGIFSKDPELIKRISFMRNFGHNGPEDFPEVGINGKSCEFHAAMGLTNLKYTEAILRRRKELWEYYVYALRNLDVDRPKINKDCDYNYAYFPIIFKNEEMLLKQVATLNAHLIYPRRYFYPSLSTLKYIEGRKTEVSDDISRRVLCLPLYYSLSFEEIDLIARLLLRIQNN